MRVPILREDLGILNAALAYSREGWYVIPVRPDTKAPNLLGPRWQDKSSVDPEEIVSWFAGRDWQLGLHVGRSGAVAFDVDEPDRIPPALAEAIKTTNPPFQSTRSSIPGKGHYLFLQPPGRRLGNLTGGLGKGWGEVRGLNGIIVLQPSVHTKPDGHYLWQKVGEVPVLPHSVADLLPDVEATVDSAPDATVAAFLAEHTAAEKPHLLPALLRKFEESLDHGGRHEALVAHAVWGMREAQLGFYPAQAVRDGLWERFETAMGGERYPRSEFRSILAWAVAQASVDAQGESRKARVDTPQSTPDDPFGTGLAAPCPTQAKPSSFFSKSGLDVHALASAVLERGPLAIGRDDRFWEYRGGVWVEAPTVVQGRCVELLRGRFRGGHASNTEIVTRHRVDRIDCEPISQYINVANGMLDWRTGELVPHDPKYRATVQLPHPYDPDATCPEFELFLKSVLSDDYIALAWEILGYLLYSGNPLQVAFLLHGTGQNGKGTLLRVIKEMLGSGNISAASLDSLNTNRFTAASLYGKIANIAGDIDGTYQESTARFKSMTGEDVLEAEHKYGQQFQFTSWAVPLFSANKIPGSADTSTGYLRRWVVLNFAREFSDTEKEIGLSDRLAREIPGIVARALPALRTLMDRGQFFIAGDVRKGHEEFAEAVDQVREWVAECCDREGTEYSEERAMLYNSYKAWANATGSGTLKAKEFYHRLSGAGFKERKTNGTRRIVGLRVRDLRMQASPHLVDNS